MKQLKNLFLIFIFLSTFKIEFITTFKCGSKTLNITPGIIDTLPKSNIRKIQEIPKPEGGGDKLKDGMEEEKNNRSIIIGYDYTLFDRNNETTNETKNQLKRLFNETSDLFNKILKVKVKRIGRNDKELKYLINTRCKVNETVENISNFVTSVNDVTIFPVFETIKDESDNGTIWMRGKYCLITRDMFPIGGLLQINKDINFEKENSYDYFKHIIFHEMTHILIFEPNLMRGLNMVKNKQVISKGVKLAARHYFNCIKFIEDEDFGVPLDEDGYHWNSRYMLGEYMISFDYFDKTMSDMTLALFDDSGRYYIDNLYGRYFNFGKNKSCSFFEKKCIENEKPNFEEFCTTNNEPKCSQSRMSKGNCLIEEYDYNISSNHQYFNSPYLGGFKETDYCPVSNYNLTQNYYFSTSCKYENNSENKEYGEIFGNDSFCFISSLVAFNSNNEIKNKSVCYKVECDYTNKMIIVNIDNKKVNCTTNGGIVFDPPGFNGSLICPKYFEICNEGSDYICKDMFDCINETLARDYVYDDESSELIKYNLILISLILSIFIIF